MNFTRQHTSLLGFSGILIALSLYTAFAAHTALRAAQGSPFGSITMTPALKELQSQYEKLKNNKIFKIPVNQLSQVTLARYRIAFDKAFDYAQKHFEKKELETVLNPLNELWRSRDVRQRMKKVNNVVERLIIEKDYDRAIERAKETI